jgi:hypothetical protein
MKIRQARRLFGWIRIGTGIISHRKRPGLMEVKSGLRGFIAKMQYIQLTSILA